MGPTFFTHFLSDFVSLWNVLFRRILIFLFYSIIYQVLLYLFATDCKNEKRKKTIFIAAITANILLLGFFKYYNSF